MDHFGYFETWLMCHKLTAQQDARFRQLLDAVTSVTGESPALYSTFDSIPVGQRNDPGFDGLSDSRLMDFTSPAALQKVEEWRRSLSR